MLCCVVVLMVIAPLRQLVDGPAVGTSRTAKHRISMAVIVAALVAMEASVAWALSRLLMRNLSELVARPDTEPSLSIPGALWPDAITIAVAIVAAACVLFVFRHIDRSRLTAGVVGVVVLGVLALMSPAARYVDNPAVRMLVLEYFGAAVPFALAVVALIRSRRTDRRTGGVGWLLVGLLATVSSMWALFVLPITEPVASLVISASMPAALMFWCSFFSLFREPFTKLAAGAALFVLMQSGSLLGLALLFTAASPSAIGAGVLMLVCGEEIALALWASRHHWNPERSSGATAVSRKRRQENYLEELIMEYRRSA